MRPPHVANLPAGAGVPGGTGVSPVAPGRRVGAEAGGGADTRPPPPPTGHTSRMSSKWGDLIPQIRENGDGTQAWYIHGEPRKGPNAVASVHGTMPDRTKPPKRWEDVPLKSYVPAERVKAMAEDGVDVHTFF